MLWCSVTVNLGPKMQQPWLQAHRCILTQTILHSPREGGGGICHVCSLRTAAVVMLNGVVTVGRSWLLARAGWNQEPLAKSYTSRGAHACCGLVTPLTKLRVVVGCSRLDIDLALVYLASRYPHWSLTGPPTASVSPNAWSH